MQAVYEFPQVTHKKSRMGLTRWSKLWIHTNMDLHLVAFKPHVTSFSQLTRFLHLWNAQQPRVKVTSHILTTDRHG